MGGIFNYANLLSCQEKKSNHKHSACETNVKIEDHGNVPLK